MAMSILAIHAQANIRSDVGGNYCFSLTAYHRENRTMSQLRGRSTVDDACGRRGAGAALCYAYLEWVAVSVAAAGATPSPPSGRGGGGRTADPACEKRKIRVAAHGSLNRSRTAPSMAANVIHTGAADEVDRAVWPA